MKQITQDISSGSLELVVVPPPVLQPNGVLVATAASLISAGTEKMLIDLAQKSLVGKAKARPDLVKQVIDKARKEGVMNTYRNVRSKMDRPMPLGYSAAGTVLEVGSAVRGISPGDRVAIAGAGYANHASVNYVPSNLVARMPDGVSFDDAAYTTVASIALQGVRLAAPAVGESVAVIGLGLIGLITIQILRANGCKVIGIDIDSAKIERGKELGMDAGVVSSSEELEPLVDSLTSGHGVDYTIITASTKSNGPIEMAGEITRRKGDVVVVGAVGMDVPRNIYYHKEITLQVSMSYGPGRYDPAYEERGIDYPYDYVRWTEQRNMEAVLDLIAAGYLDVDALTTHRFDFDRALEAYELIQTGSEPFVGVLLQYGESEPQAKTSVRLADDLKPKVETKDTLRVGFAGAGNYAQLHLLPRLKKNENVHLAGLVTATGISARKAGEKFGFESCSTDFDDLLGDATDAIFVATRHSTHADLVLRSLKAGKSVFVEKPMVVNERELGEITEAYETSIVSVPAAVMVGLNRRFSPYIARIRDALIPSEPRHMLYRVNSGPIPLDSWVYDPDEGGGMLVGEMCHFIDVMRSLAGAAPISVFATSIDTTRDDIETRDNISVSIAFADGSVGTLVYNTVGDKTAPKERLEVFSSGTTALLDDYSKVEIYRSGKRTKWSSMGQDKGQESMIEETVRMFRSEGRSPIPFEQLVEVMQVVFGAARSLATGAPIDLSNVGFDVKASTDA
ncbi:MAG: bi-domain-containing oxidoreductase [Rhodothermia bacterium]|nr:bi-domain-containing oxidoreductase [Rhodothermia bacterium]